MLSVHYKKRYRNDGSDVSARTSQKSFGMWDRRRSRHWRLASNVLGLEGPSFGENRPSPLLPLRQVPRIGSLDEA